MSRGSPMTKIVTLIYGLASYLLFLVVSLYAIGFVGNFAVPKAIDTGTAGDVVESLLIDVLLLGVFGVQHSIMARPGFKRRWTRIVPVPAERSTYVLISSLALLLLFWGWRPLPFVVWSVGSATGSLAAWGLCALGWLIALVSTFLISHLDLFGLRQVYLNLRDERYTHASFKAVGLYKLVRHPLMLGFVIAFWATPRMTLGHLTFAAAMTVYILVALRFEERDLSIDLGNAYRQYREDRKSVV